MRRPTESTLPGCLTTLHAPDGPPQKSLPAEGEGIGVNHQFGSGSHLNLGLHPFE